MLFRSLKDGYVGFDPDGDAYRALPAGIRSAMEKLMEELRAGRPDFTLGSF